MGTSPQTELRADGLSEIEDILWEDERPIFDNRALYASLPAPWARNMGFDGNSHFQPGYTPAGQPVVIEEEAIIILNPENNNE